MLTKVKNLTQTAQVAFFTLAALHVVHVLKDKRSLTRDLRKQEGKPVRENINEDEWNNTGEQLYNWCLETYQQIIIWLGEKDMFGDFFYDHYIREDVNYLGYYSKEDQPVETNSYNASSTAFYIACHRMMLYDQVGMPSDVVEVGINTFRYCLECAQQVSSDPQAEAHWQEAVLERLLKDYYTEDPNEFGPDIRWEYLQELFGQQFPFEKPVPEVEPDPIYPHFTVAYSDDIQQNVNRLTITAQVVLGLIVALRMIKGLKGKQSITLETYRQTGLSAFIEDTDEEWAKKSDQIYAFFLKSFKHMSRWISDKKLRGKYFYHGCIYNKDIYRFGDYYFFQPEEQNCYLSCLHAILFACNQMYRFDKEKGHVEVADYTIETLCESLAFASTDPQAEKQWQEGIIRRLLENFYTEDPDEFGPNISRRYIEDLLGEKLPF